MPTDPFGYFVASWQTPHFTTLIPVFSANEANALKCAAVVVHLAVQKAIARE